MIETVNKRGRPEEGQRAEEVVPFTTRDEEAVAMMARHVAHMAHELGGGDELVRQRGGLWGFSCYLSDESVQPSIVTRGPTRVTTPPGSESAGACPPRPPRGGSRPGLQGVLLAPCPSPSRADVLDLRRSKGRRDRVGDGDDHHSRHGAANAQKRSPCCRQSSVGFAAFSTRSSMEGSLGNTVKMSAYK